MAIMSGGCPSLVMVISSGAPRPDVMTIAQAARGAIIQPARLHYSWTSTVGQSFSSRASGNSTRGTQSRLSIISMFYSDSKSTSSHSTKSSCTIFGPAITDVWPRACRKRQWI